MTKTYTDDEVREAADDFSKGLDLPREGRDCLTWAAGEYLRAREVLEWYAKAGNENLDNDEGQRARDFLKGQKA